MSSILEEYIEDGKIFSPMEEFTLTDSQKLFKRFAFKFSGAYSSITGFNNWVTNILPDQIEKKSFTSPDGVKVILSDVYLHPPKKVINGKEQLIYPQYSRSRKYPYTGRLTVTCTTIKPDKTKKIMENITLGYIPIMLGSIKCNLYGKTKEELVSLGECLSDPFGYFIISSERTVIHIDKININMPIIMTGKDNPKPYIVNNYTARRRIVLHIAKKWNSILLNDPLDDNNWEGETKKIPLFVVYYVLKKGMDVDDAIEKYILPFFDRKFHKKIINALTESIIEFKSIRNIYDYLYVLRNQKDPDLKNPEKVRESLESFFYVQVFDYIDDMEDRIEAKLFSFSLIVVKLLLYIIGEIEMDDINSWVTKRFETPAVSMEILFESIFDQIIKTCRKTQGNSSVIDYSAFGLRLRSKSEGKMRNEFETSFNTDDWGVNGTKFSRANYSESTLRETPLQLWSQIDKNNVNKGSTQAAKRETREIQPSQRNHHCIIETPESEAIGYVKHNCITNIYSIRRDKKEIANIISEFCVSDPESLDDPHLVTLNGISLIHENYVCYGEGDIDKQLIKLRRTGKIPHDIEIYKHQNSKMVDVKCNSSRPLSPYLIIEKGKLVIEEKKAWNWKIEKLLKNGCVEFLSPREEEKEENTICVSVKHFYKTRKLIETSSVAMKYYKLIYNYTHCNIDPNQMFSLTGNICPFVNHQLAPRSIFQAGMAKQALGFFNINYHLRFASTFKRLYKASRPLSETMIYPVPALDIFPTGQTLMVAFYCMSENQEDAVIVSEDFLNTKGLNYITYKTIKYSQPTQISEAREKFQRPPVRKNEDPSIYRNIEESGFPKIDSYIRKGDCVIGKVLIKEEGDYNNSIYAQLDEEGFVESIEINRERDGHQVLVKIRLRRYRKYQAGDKVALRYAQKGTVGRVVKRSELLRIATGPNRGTYPHLVFNPLGFPSRQTVGLLIEGIANKAALYTGERVNVSSFQEYDIDSMEQVLRDNGLDPGGYEDMETFSGKRISKKIAVVPLYEQALRHHAMDKIQMRDIGNKNLYTHQPIGGRATGSGIRAGEMEKDSFVAHGASSVQVERLMKSSDEFPVINCNSCGNLINGKVCTSCSESDPVVIYIPYTFKLLIQLLSGASIRTILKTKKK